MSNDTTTTPETTTTTTPDTAKPSKPAKAKKSAKTKKPAKAKAKAKKVTQHREGTLAAIPFRSESDPKIENPVRFLWDLFDRMKAKNRDLKRKDALLAAFKAGCATNTSKIQYQRWAVSQRTGKPRIKPKTDKPANAKKPAKKSAKKAKA